MSKLLDKLVYFRRRPVTEFAEGFGVLTSEDRGWEDSYRQRLQYDKVVRSTHGVNCTGSCGWKVYVKGGIVTWETQVLDYPRTRADLPDHEPRGCARGASASWYLYSANRVKYPLARRHLIELWRAARRAHEPVAAWRAIVEDEDKSRAYKSARGRGGFVRISWEEATEIIAAANVYTAKVFGPDRIAGFSPIPAMSMVSYAAGTRYLSLIGGTCLSFYDWYADLPPSSPQTWGEQTDVPESADWYNAGFIMVWGSNVPQTRTPDAHFLAEVRYKGTKTVVVSPDFSEASKFADLWLDPRQGTDAALAMSLVHVVLREFHVKKATPYFLDYCREYTDMPFLVRLVEHGGRLVPERFLRADDLEAPAGAPAERACATNSGETPSSEMSEWRTVAIDEESGALVVPDGSIGFRWTQERRWNLGTDPSSKLRLTQIDTHDEWVDVHFPYFGDAAKVESGTGAARTLRRQVPVRRVALVEGEGLVATVYDLMLAHYGVDRGTGDPEVPASFDDDRPYTPAWQEAITGISREKVIAVAREFAETAARTEGRSMVILGTGINQWYHSDMTYRAIIGLLLACGCVGRSGGGFAHYVGQEKLRPQAGWSTLAFGTDWSPHPRQMNATSFWYLHTDQWRYEKLETQELLSPTAPEGDWNVSLVDYNVRSVRMGWLPTAPQLEDNPLEVGRRIQGNGEDPAAFVASALQSGELRLAIEDPDAPQSIPRNLFVWRSNLLGSSAKGHEYFLKHLVGARSGVLGEDLASRNEPLPQEVRWREAHEGKLDLLVTIDFRMSSTCLHSDLVLPSATWYEKDDLSTTDMHPFIHPLTKAVDPMWESRSDWEIFKAIAQAFSEQCAGHLGIEHDVVLEPLLHDSPAELGQPRAVRDWKKGECEPVAGKTMPSVFLVERDYPATAQRFTALGPRLAEHGCGTKGLAWDVGEEIALLREQNGLGASSEHAHTPRLSTAREACETILALSPETNGRVAVRAWQALQAKTGRSHSHLAQNREGERIRFDDLVAQPRRVITSPTWSGKESHEVSYSGSYLNVHEKIPWRTLTGRQHVYLDHDWIRAFGEGFALYRPPIDTHSIAPVLESERDGQPCKVLSFLTPHQKWGIHSSFSDTQPMLTLSRGGPCVWIHEHDARELGIEDNDWIEAFNVHGGLAARAVVSQRVKPGTAMMYHSQEKIVNTPASQASGTRGLHNSVSRIVVKPTHMIGGYAQLSYGFNYYGTVGANRDEIVVLRKLATVDWLDDDSARRGPAESGTQSSA